MVILFHFLGHCFHDKKMLSYSLTGDCFELDYPVPIFAAPLESGLFSAT